MQLRSRKRIGGSWRSDSSTAVGTRSRSARSRAKRSGSWATVHSRLPMRWRVVSLPEMKRNTSWVRASTSVRWRPSTSASSSRRDEVVARDVAPCRDQRVDVVGELRVRARQPLTALVAVERGPRALHHLVGPARPEREVLARRAEQVGDHVVRHRHHVVGDEVDRLVAREQVVEQPVAQVLAERLDVHETVHRDRGVDDAAHLTVARLGDLVDQLLLVGHDHAGLAEAGLEQLDVLRRREHVGVAGEVPRAARRARHRARRAELFEAGGVGRAR